MDLEIGEEAHAHEGDILSQVGRLGNGTLCESRLCSVLTVCGAPVGREEVSAQVILRVGLATLCILRSAQLHS